MSFKESNPVKSRRSRQKLLVFGCGYLGIRVAQASISAGHTVWATTRRPARADEFAKAGLRPLLVDWNNPATWWRLPQVDRILISVSYDRNSKLSQRESQVGGLDRLLSVCDQTTNICYLSTTGVYHQTGGEWVDESSPTHPIGEGGKAHLECEGLLRRRRSDSPWTILRLAGIYGPGRVPRIADVIAGNPIRSPEHHFLNLIHVDDAAAAVASSWQADTQRLYVISDGCPVQRGNFYGEVARQGNHRPPTFAPPRGGSLHRSNAPPPAHAVLPARELPSGRSDTNKRVWNRRMKRDLVDRIRFATYREGLSDVLRSLADET